MAIKFRKRIKIAPGIKLNLTSKGVSSVSLGGKGIALNSGGKKGAKLTTSIPGTGLSKTHQLSSVEANSSPQQANASDIGFGGLLLFCLLGLVVYLVFFS